VVQDRAQVGVGEPAGQRGGPQRPVDYGRAAQLRERAGLGLLEAMPRTPSAAASSSQSDAPRPIARNASSAAFIGFGTRTPRADSG